MSQNRRIALLIALLAVLVTGVTLGGGAAAAASGSDSGGLLNGTILDESDDRNCDPRKGVDAVDTDVCRAASEGAYDKATWSFVSYFNPARTWFTTTVSGEEPTPVVEERADEVQQIWNQNASAIEAEHNDDLDLEANRTYVLAIGFELHGEETERYLVADTDENGTATTEVVASVGDDQVIDETLRLCGYAADQAPEELRTYLDRFVGTDEQPDRVYAAKRKTRYGDDIVSSLYPTSGDCSAGDFW